MPTAVYFIVCDGVLPDPANPVRVDLIGLLAQIRSYSTPPFPVLRPQFSVFLMMADPDPAMSLTIQVVRADTGAVTARMPTLNATFPGGKGQLVGIAFNSRTCGFQPPACIG